MDSSDLVVQRTRDDLFVATRKGEEVCRAAVAISPGKWEFYSTVTTPGFEGQGIASRLVRFALDEARLAGVKVVPRCWYVDGLMRRHAPDYEDLRA